MKTTRLIVLFLFLLTGLVRAQDGKMYVIYNPAKKPFGQAMEGALKKSKGLDVMAQGFTQLFKLPRDLPLILAETGEINCWYDGNKHRVVVSYEFVEFLFTLFSKHTKNSDEAAEQAAGTLIFTLLHELGHAFIGELDIPTTGREEDAADEFAVLLLNQMGKEGQGYAVCAAQWFNIMSQRRNNKDLPFWDEHSLDQQRFYDIFALLYGSDPNRFMFVEKFIPEARLSRALRDYKKKEKAWDRLLQPCMRAGVTL